MKLERLVCSWFGAGWMKPAPGTWGSLAALPLGWLLFWLAGPPLLAVATVNVFLIGWWASERIVQADGLEDPSWVVIDEVAPGFWTGGGIDMTAQLLPCIAMIYLPAGVLDAATRAHYVCLVHDAFRQALPPADQRRLVTSMIVHDVTEGSWGVNGAIWRLPDFAEAAGFSHLKSLCHAN